MPYPPPEKKVMASCSQSILLSLPSHTTMPVRLLAFQATMASAPLTACRREAGRPCAAGGCSCERPQTLQHLGLTSLPPPPAAGRLVPPAGSLHLTRPHSACEQLLAPPLRFLPPPDLCLRSLPPTHR